MSELIPKVADVPLPYKESKEFYVSNKQLYEEYVSWYASLRAAAEVGAEEPQIPPFIVDAMMKISRRLTYNHKFINYTFKDDMISDALYDCVRFAKKFKEVYVNKDGETLPGNPFSYLTTICFNAFLRRIDKEKTQKYVKAMIVAESPDEDFLDSACEDDAHYKNSYIEFLREVGTSDECLPMSLKRSKKLQKEKAGPLSAFENE